MIVGKYEKGKCGTKVKEDARLRVMGTRATSEGTGTTGTHKECARGATPDFKRRGVK